MKIENHTLEEYIQNSKYTSFALEKIDGEMLVMLSNLHRNSFFQIIIIKKGEGSSLRRLRVM